MYKIQKNREGLNTVTCIKTMLLRSCLISLCFALKIGAMPAFFGRGLPALSTSTPQQPLQLSTVPLGTSIGSSSGISSIAHTMRGLSTHSLSSGVHSLTRDQTTSSLATTSTLSRREEESKFQTPGMRTLKEYRKKTKDNIENSKLFIVLLLPFFMTGDDSFSKRFC